MNVHSERKGAVRTGAGSSAKRPTMRDVAELAGVSHQTVSRFLRQSGGLKPDTYASIESAIAQLGYRPDLTARTMRTGRTDTLAVVISGPPRGDMYLRELTAACAVAHEAGFRTEIVLVEGDAEARTQRILGLLAAGQVDGVLAMAPVATARLRGDRRVVVTEDLDDDMRNTGALADGSTAGAVVAHLAELGHRHFLHVAGDPSYASARNRARAYQEAVVRLGLVSHGVVGHSWSADTGYTAVQRLADDTPVTAVITANDTAAFGAIRAAFDRGWSVPDRLSVFGWDNQIASQFGIPTLSTVAVDREVRGQFVMQQLIAAIRDRTAPPAPQGPLNRLIFRESTAPPPDEAR